MKKVFYTSTICLFISLSLFAQTQVKIDSLKQVLEQSKEDTNKVNILNDLSKRLVLAGNLDEAKSYANDALILSMSIQLGKQKGWPTGKANAYNNIGVIYYNQNNYSEALRNHNEALKIRLEIGDKLFIGKSYSNIANVYVRQGNYAEALKYYAEYLNIAQEAGDKKSIANAYNNIGIVHSRLGNFPEALKSYFASLRIREEIGDREGVGNSYITIGNLYCDQANYEEALKNFFLAQKIKEEIGDKIGIGTCYEGIGIVYKEQGKFSEALKSSQSALKIWKEIGDEQGAAVSYVNIGAIYQEQGNYNEALKCYSEVLRISEEIGDKQNSSLAYHNTGVCYADLKNYPKALEYLKKSLSLSSELGEKNVIKDCYSTLAEIYAEMNNYSQAYKYQRLYSQLKDTLLNEDNNKVIAQMKEQYESDKKDQQITLLNKDKELQTQETRQQQLIRNFVIGGAIGVITLLSLVFYQLYRRRQAKSSLEIHQLNNKVLRTQLNPHFIFNALNSIRNYIQQHAELADNYLTKFSTLMRQVLENSAEEKISLQDEIAMLENYMDLEALRLPFGFDYEVTVANHIDAANTMIPPMILQPMVENAIWHGLKPLNRKGKIILRFTESDGLLQSIIEDDGIGLGSATIETKTPEKKRSMGMQITRERIDLLNRKAKVKGWLKQKLLDHGSQVEMAIPV